MLFTLRMNTLSFKSAELMTVKAGGTYTLFTYGLQRAKLLRELSY
jgi:hypothetical protein